MDKAQGAKLRKVWRQMLRRCENPKDYKYERYGGRGITVCPEWHRWEPFRDWAIGAGYGPGLSINRLDNDGPYQPDNCEWADRWAQANNKSTSVMATAFGETKTLTEWSRDPRCQCTAAALSFRVQRRGWDIVQALVTPNLGAGVTPHDPDRVAAYVAARKLLREQS